MSVSTNSSKSEIACVVPTYNGREDLSRLLDSLDEQDGQFDVFVVDSSSNDGTYELACSRIKNVISIPSSQFNHGGTRQMMVSLHPEYDVYVFLTQDAYLADKNAIVKLIEPFKEKSVGAVCGRQLPHADASPLAAHARLFNYPKESLVKSIDDASRLGVKAAFISNSFAAYRREALVAVGGFPKHVILSEDMYVAAKMLLSGWKVAYEGMACCHHSHNYTIMEEFRRYFDIGVFFAQELWIKQRFGSAGGEGLRFVKSEICFVGFWRPMWLLNSIVRSGCKLLAYKLGQKEGVLPMWLKRRLSMHRRFWQAESGGDH